MPSVGWLQPLTLAHLSARLDRNNPFLDPPLPTAATLGHTRRPSEDARSLASVRTYDSAAPGPRSMPQMAAFPSYPAGRQQSRPVSARAPSESGTLSSATSMQLFGTTGGLRVTNDPANISTPAVGLAPRFVRSATRLTLTFIRRPALTRRDKRQQRIAIPGLDERGGISAWNGSRWQQRA